MWQIAIVLIIYLPLVILTGHYLYRVTLHQKTWLDPILDKVDAVIYKLCGIKQVDMNGKEYVLSLILSNAIMVFIGYFLLRIQSFLFLNPNNISNMEATLSFNTIISFITNTNLQHYRVNLDSVIYHRC